MSVGVLLSSDNYIEYSLSGIALIYTLHWLHIPHYHFHCNFGDLIAADDHIQKEFAFFLDLSETHPSDEGNHSQSQNVDPIDSLAHITHLCALLKQDVKRTENTGLTETRRGVNYHSKRRLSKSEGRKIFTSELLSSASTFTKTIFVLY